MKHRKTLLAIGSIVIIASAFVKILHLPIAYLSNSIVALVLIGMFAIQSLHVKELEKKIERLENKNVA